MQNQKPVAQKARKLDDRSEHGSYYLITAILKVCEENH